MRFEGEGSRGRGGGGIVDASPPLSVRRPTFSSPSKTDFVFACDCFEANCSASRFREFTPDSFMGFSPGPLLLTGRTVPKSHRSSWSESRAGESSRTSCSSSSLSPCRACHRSCLSISSVRYVVFFALLIHGCLSRSFALGLSFGSFFRHSCTKSLNDEEN